MSTAAVSFCVTAVIDDPQVLARVIAVFAARSHLPRRLSCLAEATSGQVEIEIECDAGQELMPDHLARILDRIPTVTEVKLFINGRNTTFSPSNC